MVISRWREQAENVLSFLFGILEEGDSGQISEVDLMLEFVFVLVFVNGEIVRAED